MNKLRILRYQILSFIRDNFLIHICAKNRFLSNIYYCFFSKEFAREHQKVLLGKKMFLENLKGNKPNEFHLRRMIHRLEKGLIMRDLRDVFAVDYIGDAVEEYIKLLSYDNAAKDTMLLKWSHDVLSMYFLHTKAELSSEISAAKAKFEQQAYVSELPDNMVPYKRNSNMKSKVSFEQFLELAHQRRSVRWFKQQPVDRELIYKALEIATLSPSACNRQPFEFRIFDEEQLKNRVGAIPMGIRTFFKNVPVFVVVVGRLSAYLHERDRHVIYIDGGLASMSFMLALETLGLSSVPINWPDIEEIEKEMEALIKLGKDERPIMIIGLGYADEEGKIPYSQKKAPQVISRFN